MKLLFCFIMSCAVLILGTSQMLDDIQSAHNAMDKEPKLQRSNENEQKKKELYYEKPRDYSDISTSEKQRPIIAEHGKSGVEKIEEPLIHLPLRNVNDSVSKTGVRSSAEASSTNSTKRLWGAASGSGLHTHDSELLTTKLSSGHPSSVEYQAPIEHGSPEFTARAPQNEGTDISSSTEKTDSGQHIPFFAKSSMKGSAYRNPPQGFTLAARVYVDPHDKLAHFDDSPPSIPYWDCGSAGSTTSPLPLRHGFFRHALTGGAGSTSWKSSGGSPISDAESGTNGGKRNHPVLVIALSALVIDLNSGESQEFDAGAVILLEDVLLPGHKLRPLNTHYEVSVLFLTLPNPYTHTGKNHCSLPSTVLTSTSDPCSDGSTENKTASSNGSVQKHYGRENKGFALRRPVWLGGRRLRRLLFAVLGLSVSALAADFLGRTAPLWLAVGIGGACFIIAGTWAFVTSGDALLMAAEVWYERRKLGAATMNDNSPSDDDDKSFENMRNATR